MNFWNTKVVDIVEVDKGFIKRKTNYYLTNNYVDNFWLSIQKSAKKMSTKSKNKFTEIVNFCHVDIFIIIRKNKYKKRSDQ